ncbi:UPF0426 protein [Actinidia chinensis var. chinensis]|uniref:UPF0426 protein n=1 Tax=Actinidia chinensis var. chinensis TaxID=1590841 RepID=A0A2R6PCG0_ACTCC|nr:UPF0426 protein [Actinidia chinensis var. chinensis]
MHIKMSLILCSSPNCSLAVTVNKLSSSSISSLPKRHIRVKAFNCNPPDVPILKEALKEPVAFMGGLFAGLLRLDLNENPLKEWVVKTVEASGIKEEEIDTEGSTPEEEGPQQIEIE